MKRAILFLFLLAGFSSFGQSPADLASINSRAKVLYIKPEAIDRLMIELRPFETMHGNGVDSLLMDTYRVLSKGYADNNHFRQAYDVYNKYLNYKAESLSLSRRSTINEKFGSISSRSSKDQADRLDKKNQFEQLQIDIDQLATKRKNFRRYSTFGIVALSILFAAMLVRAGVRFSNLRSKIQSDRTKMKSIQRMSVLGHFAQGYKDGLLASLTEIENSVLAFRPILKKSGEKQAAQADVLAGSISKSVQEIKSQLKK
ncbi:MAG: hypothetical protein IPP51_09535 [Bacteroidetes bacterium]|nr:hypothetical protein [Bacteroidota bacterium]